MKLMGGAGHSNHQEFRPNLKCLTKITFLQLDISTLTGDVAALSLVRLTQGLRTAAHTLRQALLGRIPLEARLKPSISVRKTRALLSFTTRRTL